MQPSDMSTHKRKCVGLVDKQIGECHIIDVACPFDARVKENEQEEVEQYHELKRDREISTMQKMVVIPIIIRALGTIGKCFRTWIRKIQMENYCDLLQKACLLGTAKIIRKIFDT